MKHNVKKPILSTDINALEALFSYLSKQPNTVCHLSALDYDSTLFTSEQLGEIWGMPPAQLMEKPELWFECLLPTDRPNMNDVFDPANLNRYRENGTMTIFYRVNTSFGTIRHIRDTHFILKDRFGKPIANAGIAENISPELWHAFNSTKKQKQLMTLNTQINLVDILKKEQLLVDDEVPDTPGIERVDCIKVKDKLIPLTEKEADYLYYARLGNTVAKTAKIVHRSPRTIQDTLTRIRERAGCDSMQMLLALLKPVYTQSL